MSLARVVMMFALLTCLTAPGCERSEDVMKESLKIVGVLDSLHASAAKADGKTYFGLFAPDAIFLGTDASERWTLAQFRAYAEPYFAKGQGWTYTVSERTVTREGSVAWFDERLSNAKYGECRGTGVLIKREGAWKIVQYNLTVPIPNDLLPKVAEQIRAMKAPTPADTKDAPGSADAKSN